MRRAIWLLVITSPLAAGTPEPIKLDLHGDPLPAGAVQRLGKFQLGWGYDQLNLSSDGKSIICLRHGTYILTFDRKTGRHTETRVLPTEAVIESCVSGDGRRAILIRRPPNWSGPRVLEVWDLERLAKLTTIRPNDRGSTTVAISPDGQFVVTTDCRESGPEMMRIQLIIWDASTGKETTRTDFEVPIRAEAGGWTPRPNFSPDGQYLLFSRGIQNSTFHFAFDRPTLKMRWQRTITGGGYFEEAPNGQLLLGNSVVVSWKDGKDIPHRLPPDLGEAFVIGFVDRGATMLYVVGEGKTRRLKTWDWKNGRAAAGIAEIPLGPNTWVRSWDNDEAPVLLLHDGSWRAHDLRTGKPLWPDTAKTGHTLDVTTLVFSADGQRLASAGDDNVISIWDVRTGRQLYRCQTTDEEWRISSSWNHPFGPVLDFSTDGRRLAFAESLQNNVRLRVIDLADGRTVRTHALPPNTQPANDRNGFGRVGFTQGGNQLLVTHGALEPFQQLGQFSTLSRWDLRTGWCMDVGRIARSSPTESAWLPVGQKWLAGGKALSPTTGRAMFDFDGAGTGPLVSTVDGRLVAGVSRPAGPTFPDWALRGQINDVRVWDGATGATVVRLPWERPNRQAPVAPPQSAEIQHEDPLLATWPRQLALHPSGHWLATADSHGVRLWDLTTGRVVHTFPLPIGPPIERNFGSPATAIAFTPDGTRLATGLPDGTILFWPVPAIKPNPPRADELASLWADLIGPEPDKGWRAAWRLMDDPPAAARLIRANLKPAEQVPAADVDRLLKDADSPEFRRREAATRRLEAIVDRVHPAVADAEKATVASPELRERLRKVLAATPGDDRSLPSWASGLSRAVAVLEHVQSTDGDAVLRDLARGAPGAWLTREAEAALGRTAAGKR